MNIQRKISTLILLGLLITLISMPRKASAVTTVGAIIGAAIASAITVYFIFPGLIIGGIIGGGYSLNKLLSKSDKEKINDAEEILAHTTQKYKKALTSFEKINQEYIDTKSYKKQLTEVIYEEAKTASGYLKMLQRDLDELKKIEKQLNKIANNLNRKIEKNKYILLSQLKHVEQLAQEIEDMFINLKKLHSYLKKEKNLL